eukprot:350808-Chlamydomonas_euryale.AAC.5
MRKRPVVWALGTAGSAFRVATRVLQAALMLCRVRGRVRVVRSGPIKGMSVLSAARQRGSSSGLGAVTKATPLRMVLSHPIPSTTQACISPARIRDGPATLTVQPQTHSTSPHIPCTTPTRTHALHAWHTSHAQPPLEHMPCMHGTPAWYDTHQERHCARS